MRNKDEHPITSIEMTQKVAELEFGISQKVHQMQQELISTFQRQLDEHRKQLEEEFQRKHEGLREQIERFQQSLQLDLEQK